MRTAGVLALCSLAASSASPQPATRLRVDGVEPGRAAFAPTGPDLRLTWAPRSDERGAEQSAYRVVARERRGEECGFVVHRYARRRRRRGGDRDREAGQEASHHDRLFY